MFDSATLSVIEKRSLTYRTKCFFEYFMITTLKEQMCAYHQKFTPGAALVSHYLLKSCRKSLQNVFDGVADCRAHCPEGLVYHVSSKGHIFTVKNKHRPFRRGEKKKGKRGRLIKTQCIDSAKR